MKNSNLIVRDFERELGVLKRNKIRHAFNYTFIILFFLGGAFAIASFYVKESLIWWFAGISMAAFVLILVLFIVEKQIIKNLKKKSNF